MKVPILIPTTGKNVNNIVAGLTAILSNFPSPNFGPIVYCLPELSPGGCSRRLSADYTMQHLNAMALSLNVEIEFIAAPHSKGVADQCDKLMRYAYDELDARAAIMLGDDVLPRHDAFVRLTYWDFPYDGAFICGAKCDIVNDRNYPDFVNEVVQYPSELKDYGSTHVRLAHTISMGSIDLRLCTALDSGFCYLNLHQISRPVSKIKFAIVPEVNKLGGEDTLLAMQCLAQDLRGFFNPGAFAWHLNNPGSIFHGKEAKRLKFLREYAAKHNLPTSPIDEAFQKR